MKKPFTRFLGLNRTFIEPSQIPFDHKTLSEPVDFIENEYGEILYYRDGKYRLHTNDIREYLVNWFSKWKKV